MAQYRKCVYYGCQNNRSNYGGTFFKFPKNEQRQTEWLKRCGNSSLIFKYAETSSLVNKLICDIHFDNNYFVNYTRGRLCPNAIPKMYESVESSELPTTSTTPTEAERNILLQVPPKRRSSPREIYPPSKRQRLLDRSPDISNSSDSLEKAVVDMPIPRKSKTALERNLTSKLQFYKEKLRNFKLQRDRLRKKVFLLKNSKANIFEGSAEAVKTFFSMQLKKRGLPWNIKAKNLSLSLYLKSPISYKHMRNTLRFNLPSIGSIRHWLKCNNLMPGLDETLEDRLKFIVNGMQEMDKNCVLLFDEMSLKKGLEYNHKNDFIEGFQDLGKGKRTEGIANHGIVFMLRGLLTKWKHVISYLVTSGPVTTNDLFDHLVILMKSLQKLNFNVRAFVCDQGGNNRSLFNKLHKTSVFSKIFLIHDVPHLVKSIRNNLISDKHVIKVNDAIVSWDDVVNFYELDKSNKSRSCCNLSEKHVRPNTFDRMRVRLATQVFSNKVYTGICTAIKTGEMKSATAPATAEFLKNMNDIFDCLNSKVIFDSNPLRCALSNKKLVVEATLHEGISWLKSISITKKKCNTERNDIYCFNGLISSIENILQLYQQLSEEGCTFLLTGRLNQDPLESFFSKIRRAGGNNSNPTVRSFRIALQHCISCNLEKPSASANCEIDEDDDTVFETDDYLNLNDQVPTSNSTKLLQTTACNFSGDVYTESDDDYEEYIKISTQSANLESCSIKYFGGYIVHSLIKKFNCDICKSDLLCEGTLNDDHELLILLRDYGNDKENIKYLKNPTNLVLDVTNTVLTTFEKTFSKIKSAMGIRQTINSKSEEVLRQKFPEFFNVPQNCLHHRIFFIECLIKMKLFKSLKWLSNDLKASSCGTAKPKPHRRLQHLRNV